MLSNFRFAAGRIVPIRLVYGVACWLTLSLTSTVFGQEEVLSEVAPPTGDSVRAEAILEDLHSAPSGLDSETLVVGTQDVPDGAESTRPAPPQDDVTSFFAQAVKAQSAFEKLQLQQQIQRLVYTMQSMSTQLEGMEKLQNQRSGMKLPSQEKLQHTSEEFGRALKEYLAELKTELERPETGRFPEITGRFPETSAAQAAQNAQIQSFFQQQQRAEEKAAAAMKAARERQVESMELLKKERDAVLKSNRMAFERARELAAPSGKDVEFLRRQLQLQHEREQRKLTSEGQAFEPSQMFRPSPTPVHPLPGKPIVAPERLEQLESRLERIESLLERLLQDKIPLKN